MRNKIKNFLKKHKFVIRFYEAYQHVHKRFICRDLYKNSSVKKLKNLKNTKTGKRCFIIGNGPSLSINDLEKIKGEDSFAVNRIYRIFDKTEWRPTYFFAQDTRIVDEIKDDVGTLLRECSSVFLNSSIYKQIKYGMKKKDNLYFIYIDTDTINCYPNLPEFSENISERFHEGFTVTYACIQMAVYMGYSEIYILGIDHSYNANRKPDGTVEENKNVQNYMPGIEGKLVFLPQLDKTTLAYRKARMVCDEKKIIIKNATRGGMLEEFERVDFDELVGQ